MQIMHWRRRRGPSLTARAMPGVDAGCGPRGTGEDVVGDPAIEIEVTQVFGGAPGSVLRDDVMKAYAEAVHRRFPGAPIIPEMSTGGSDGAAFRAAGIPTYGVQGTWIVVPDDMRMHGLDERLPVKALFDNVDHWHDLIAALAGS